MKMTVAQRVVSRFKHRSNTMAGKKKSKARPGSTVTRKSTRGKNKGDTVRFVANSSKARLPGKLNPKAVVTDRGAKNTSTVKTVKKKHKKK